MKKKTIFFIIILIAITSTLSAKFETWIGSGLISHVDTVANENKKYYTTMNPDPYSINTVNMVGPSVDIAIYPFSPIRLGLKAATQFVFPVGYNKAQGFRSYHADYKNRNMLSLDYALVISEQVGFFFGLGYEYDFYRIAKTNTKNTIVPPEYYRFNNHGLFGEIGLLTTIEHGYFKFGANISYSVQYGTIGHDFIFLGGFRI